MPGPTTAPLPVGRSWCCAAKPATCLARSVAERMVTEIPDVEVVTVPGVGHAPDLDEPEAVAAIDRLLERVLRR